MAVLLLLLLACGDKDGDDTGGDDTGASAAVNWTIDHTLALCSGEGQWFCPRGRRDGASAWEEIPCGIDGLDFVWGTTYTLRAEVTGFSDPAVDGCGDVWTLVGVDDEVFDGGGLAFALDGVWTSHVVVDGDGGTLGGYAYTCADAAVCAALDAAMAAGGDLDLQLRIGAAAGAPLVLEGVGG